MPTLIDPAARRAILDRIALLAPDARPAWGRFSAPQMVCHLACDLRHSLGELSAGPARGPLARPPLNWLAIHVMPWPRGKGTSPPEFLAVPPTTWAADLGALRELVERFAARGAGAAWPASPVFGRISGASYGVMVHKHLDHHLRQFGV